MARRGFFAEIQHQAQVAARDRERAQRVAVREHDAAVRRAEQAHRASERAQAQYARASEAERKRLDKEARDAHVAAMEAEVEERNLALAEVYNEIDSLLDATLQIDDYVDLETLRTPAHNPPFDRPDLEHPIGTPPPAADPPEPVFLAPPPAGLFGKKKHAEAVAAAEAEHQIAVEQWNAECNEVEQRRFAASQQHAQAEADRVAQLQVERRRYEKECAGRELAAAERSKELDQLIANLGYGTVDAVQEYVSIVLSNSVYPSAFPVAHKFRFDPSSAELQLKAVVPGPEAVPDVKAYKYSKASDSITSTPLSQREVKERYTRAVHQVALRSLHEVFEADRRGLIKAISIEVGIRTTDPATGRPVYLPFVAAAAGREAFLEYDLAVVVPAATLGHLGAAMSKDPFNLVPANASGVRRA